MDTEKKKCRHRDDSLTMFKTIRALLGRIHASSRSSGPNRWKPVLLFSLMCKRYSAGFELGDLWSLTTSQPNSTILTRNIMSSCEVQTSFKHHGKCWRRRPLGLILREEKRMEYGNTSTLRTPRRLALPRSWRDADMMASRSGLISCTLELKCILKRRALSLSLYFGMVVSCQTKQYRSQEKAQSAEIEG